MQPGKLTEAKLIAAQCFGAVIHAHKQNIQDTVHIVARRVYVFSVENFWILLPDELSFFFFSFFF